MTTEALRERTTTPAAGNTATGGLRADVRPATTVPVLPLWERPRKGGRG
ncbi:hypothetical protein QFZ55_005135 [Streptomyces luteogriseus]|nr:hypothetical protein [Streptomyces luteogriseus]